MGHARLFEKSSTYPSPVFLLIFVFDGLITITRTLPTGTAFLDKYYFDHPIFCQSFILTLGGLYPYLNIKFWLIKSQSDHAFDQSLQVKYSPSVSHSWVYANLSVVCRFILFCQSRTDLSIKINSGAMYMSPLEDNILILIKPLSICIVNMPNLWRRWRLRGISLNVCRSIKKCQSRLQPVWGLQNKFL